MPNIETRCQCGHCYAVSKGMDYPWLTQRWREAILLRRSADKEA